MSIGLEESKTITYEVHYRTGMGSGRMDHAEYRDLKSARYRRDATDPSYNTYIVKVTVIKEVVT